MTALTSAFADDRSKQVPWAAFVRQAAVAEETPELPEIVKHLAEFFEPLLEALQDGKLGVSSWTPSQGWR